MVEESGENWLSLESNPEVMNPYIEKLGFDAKKFSFCDLMSTDEWA
jgi:ubiquitin carboxyl-terminal hydrolase L3